MKTREVYGFDLDGVLFETFQPLIDYYNRRFGTSFKREDFRQFQPCKTWGGTRERDHEIIKEFYQSEDFKRIVPVQDAVEGINSIEGDKVIITSRPDEIKQATYDCIDLFFYKKFEAIYFSNEFFGGKGKTKPVFCNEIGIRTFVEDNLETGIQCASQGIRAIVLDSPWNQSSVELHGVERAQDWPDIVRII